MQFSLLNLKWQLFVKYGVKRMVLKSGSCQNYTALFIWLFKRRQELVGYSEAGQCQFFDRNEQISMVHIKRLWCQGTWEVRGGDFLPSLFNSFYLISRINSSLTWFCPQSTWIWFYCSWPQRRRRRIKWGRDRVMDFSRREGSDKFMQKWRWIFTIRRFKRKCLGFIHQQWRGIGGEYKEATGKSSTQITFS